MAHVVVAGGGPSGMMAAIQSARGGNSVTLIERNSRLGKKLLLTGKGRCNLTNTCGLDDFLLRFSGNGAFLRDAFKAFFNKELISFFQDSGVKIKVERQKRAFPVSDSSISILNALKDKLHSLKVKLIFNTRVIGIDVEDSKVKSVRLSGGEKLDADKLIIATGGVSYSSTGSCGDGYRLAKKLGHKITPIKPGLVPLTIKQPYIKKLEGLSLKNIQLKFSNSKKNISSDIGEIIFTHTGISGPLVLTLSGRLLDMLEQGKGLVLDIDLKPALNIEKLDARIQRELQATPKKLMCNILKKMLPQRLVSVFLGSVGIDTRLKASQVTREDRRRVVTLFKGLRFDIIGSPGIERAMVTRGGIALKEIYPRTMQSKLIKGLYFCGEILDIDADTGGFNLQAAFSTGYIAGLIK